MSADHLLIKRCMDSEPFAWEEFVDHYMELVLMIIQETARLRERTLSDEEQCELCEAVFRSFRYNHFQLLREFDFRSSAAAYLIVLIRRIVIALVKCSAE
ncbi:MAG: hypothetical protein Q4G69_00445 [Planctomycetia bacterium]|nr:hypothetical protein [Planctomycetia bacterium]